MPQRDHADVPLICDPVPGPPVARLVLELLRRQDWACPIGKIAGALHVHREEIKAAIAYLESKELVFRAGFFYQRWLADNDAVSAAQWPDAEFCAA